METTRYQFFYVRQRAAVNSLRLAKRGIGRWMTYRTTWRNLRSLYVGRPFHHGPRYTPSGRYVVAKRGGWHWTID